MIIKMKKDYANTMKVTFPAMSKNEALARSCVAAFAAQSDPTVEEMTDIRSAVCEAVTNCIVHAYRNGTGEITMTMRMTEDDTLYIKITDKGVGISDIKQAMTPLFTTAPEEERAGLGFAVMEAFTDSLKVTSKPGKGTSVIMKKRLTDKFRASDKSENSDRNE